jgi:phosphatidylglycerol:prolipoprotein diacylglycerol transferase
MHPTLLTFGKWNIPTYTVLLDLGLVLGLLLTYFEARRILGRGEIGLDLELWVLVGGILAGRAAYVLANWNAFVEDWARTMRIWEGGVSFHGAFLGGLLALGLFAWAHPRVKGPVPFWQLADVLTLGLALSTVFGWAACLMGGCAHGLVGEGVGTMILPDLFGVEAPRFATQMVGLAYSLALFIGFWLVRKRWSFDGAAFLMYVLLYFSGIYLLEFTRGDEAIYIGPWRLTQVVDLLLALAASVGLLVLWWRERNGAGRFEDGSSTRGSGKLEAVAPSAEV